MYNTYRLLRGLHFPYLLELRARKNVRPVIHLSRVSVGIFPLDRALAVTQLQPL